MRQKKVFQILLHIPFKIFQDLVTLTVFRDDAGFFGSPSTEVIPNGFGESSLRLSLSWHAPAVILRFGLAPAGHQPFTQSDLRANSLESDTSGDLEHPILADLIGWILLSRRKSVIFLPSLLDPRRPEC